MALLTGVALADKPERTEDDKLPTGIGCGAEEPLRKKRFKLAMELWRDPAYI